ncbi:MAG: lipocalin-like domain-containing protein [Tannerellaceae bacterium]|nr:lipocalin-like domain-containing protein [Tannerellaceae bacterium]
MNNLLIAGFLSICLVGFVACSKDTDDKLDGKWQMQQIEANNNVQKVDTIFYNFQTSLFQYQIYNSGANAYPSRYGFKTIKGDKELLLELEANNDFLKQTDWTSKERIFTIEKVTATTLILTSEGKRYTFRKF